MTKYNHRVQCVLINIYFFIFLLAGLFLFVCIAFTIPNIFGVPGTQPPRAPNRPYRPNRKPPSGRPSGRINFKIRECGMHLSALPVLSNAAGFSVNRNVVFCTSSSDFTQEQAAGVLGIRPFHRSGDGAIVSWFHVRETDYEVEKRVVKSRAPLVRKAPVAARPRKIMYFTRKSSIFPYAGGGRT